MRIEGSSDDSFVSVILDGIQAPISVTISLQAMQCPSERLSQSVEDALKEAYRNSSRIMQSTMAAMLEEAGVPPEENFYRKRG